jgi:hypothetical protein
MIELRDVKVGSIVWVKTNFGAGDAVQAIVDEVDADIKNGLPGIGYTLKNGTDKNGSWAYLSQVIRVVKY